MKVQVPPLFDLLVTVTTRNLIDMNFQTTINRRHSQKIHFRMDPESIVISGMAGRFPGCDNVEELQQALIDGVNLVSEDHGRWAKNFYDMTNHGGVMKDIEHFDSDFFGIPPRQVDGLDPRTRILLELTFEAFIDAGYNPLDVRGSKTAVLVGKLPIHFYTNTKTFRDNIKINTFI